MGFLDSISSGIGGLLGGGAIGNLAGGAVGGLISGVGSMIGQQQTNAQNMAAQGAQYYYNAQLQQQAQEVNREMASTAFDRSQQQLKEVEDYNSRMANTAFQRMTSDMKAAGLNPILGISSGGSPSPTVTASAPAAPGSPSGGVGMPQMQSALGAGISSALQGSKLFGALQAQGLENENTKKQGSLIDAQADKTATDAKNAQSIADATVGKLNADAGASSASAQASLALAEKTRNESAINSVVGGSGDLWDLRSYVPAARKLWDYVSPQVNPETGLPKNAVGPINEMTVHPR